MITSLPATMQCNANHTAAPLRIIGKGQQACARTSKWNVCASARMWHNAQYARVPHALQLCTALIKASAEALNKAKSLLYALIRDTQQIRRTECAYKQMYANVCTGTRKHDQIMTKKEDVSCHLENGLAFVHCTAPIAMFCMYSLW